MLRHYSTSRTAVMTTALTVCLGILGWILTTKPPVGSALPLLIAEGALITYAIWLSRYFSIRYEQVRRGLARIEADEDLFLYSSIVSARLQSSAPEADSIDKTLPVMLIVLHVAFYIYYFFFLSVPAASPTPQKPVAFQASQEDQENVRAAIVAVKDLCAPGESPKIDETRIPAADVARVVVSCPSGAVKSYLVEKVNNNWQVTAPRSSAPPAPPAAEPAKSTKAKKKKGGRAR
jgi:hypothetical protein